MTDLIVILVLVLAIGAAAGYVYKTRKSGGKCIGCAACKGGHCCGDGESCGCEPRKETSK